MDRTLYLDGNWEVCLTELIVKYKLPPKERIINVYCDICGESVINGKFEPLLRRAVLEHNEHFVSPHLYYLPVIKSEINEIGVNIKIDGTETVNKIFGQTEVVLHFKIKDKSVTL